MKNILRISAIFGALLLGACNTSVQVDSQANPVANYNSCSGIFTGSIRGSVPTVFNAARLALSNDMHYYVNGEITKNPNAMKLRARTISDEKVIITITPDPKDPAISQVEIDVDGLINGQKIFNAIARQAQCVFLSLPE